MSSNITERPIFYRYDDGILYVWVDHKWDRMESTGSFKVKLEGEVVIAYDFQGIISIAEIKKGKFIFKQYEGL